jgi:hypothetical protein
MLSLSNPEIRFNLEQLTGSSAYPEQTETVMRQSSTRYQPRRIYFSGCLYQLYDMSNSLKTGQYPYEILNVVVI